MTKTMPAVAICIPTIDSVTVEWVLRTWSALFANPQDDFSKFCRLLRGSLSIAQKRNMMVEASLKDSKTTHVLFVDHDILYEGDEINQGIRDLLKSNVDIVSGIVRCRQPKFPYMAYYVNEKEDHVTNITDEDISKCKTDLMPVGTLGCSFVLISRQVFDKVPTPWFMVNPYTPSTEDIQFFIRAKKVGFQSYINKNVRLTHMSYLKIKSDGKIETVY